MPTLGHGKICHVELPAADPAASAAFYERVFGWKVRRDGMALVFDDPTEEVSTGRHRSRDCCSTCGWTMWRRRSSALSPKGASGSSR